MKFSIDLNKIQMTNAHCSFETFPLPIRHECCEVIN